MPANASLSEPHHPDPYRPDRRLPAGAIDCHMHIYGPPDRFGPPTPNGLCGRAHLADYLALRQQLGLARTVYVQPSHYGHDNSCMLAAMAADPAPARGVAVIGAAGPDSDFAALHVAGVRGARFSFLFAGCLTLDELEPVAARIADFGWHAQIQLDGATLPDLETRLTALPVPLVIDHLGRIPLSGRVDTAAHMTLYRLLDRGVCWVKLSAPYHVSADPTGDCADCAPLARHLLAHYPDRLVWGTNWPHPNALDNPPDDRHLLRLLRDWCGDATTAHQVLVANPERLYGF